MLRKEVEVKTTKQIYVAEDGREFITEQECIAYEEELNKQVSVNDMLWTALMTPSKKRKCEYQAELEALGYEIWKDGRWHISKGNNYIEKYYDENYIRSKKTPINYGKYFAGGHRSKGKKKWINGHWVDVPKEKINLVGILDAAPTYYEPVYRVNWIGAPVSKSVCELKQAIKDRDFNKNILDNAEAKRRRKIAEAEALYKKEIEYANSTYEWSIKSASSDLERANETINKLLRKEV